MKYKKNKKDLEVEFSKEAFATLNLALELMSRTKMSGPNLPSCQFRKIA